ncbi:MAG: adenylate kinase [Nanoarchaeota archaeon]
MKIVVMGSPGVGKGTYTQALKEELGLVHVSTGDIFRENIKNKTGQGRIAEKCIAEGKLVSDDLTIKLVKERLSRSDCKSKGFILDGFPRTIAQAEALESITKADMVINFLANDKVIIERISGRIICKNCGRIFHKRNIIPKVAGRCDSCNGELYQRDDDNPKTVKQRLEIYRQQTAPLMEYYRRKELLREIVINEDFGVHRKAIMEKILGVIRRG